jgi:hypothetical protein
VRKGMCLGQYEKLTDTLFGEICQLLCFLRFVDNVFDDRETNDFPIRSEQLLGLDTR